MDTRQPRARGWRARHVRFQQGNPAARLMTLNVASVGSANAGLQIGDARDGKHAAKSGLRLILDDNGRL
jgi:hypothetical protein